MQKLKLLASFGCAILLYIVVWGGVTQSTQALDYVVTNAQDSGSGSLREAIDLANANPNADTITFDPALSGQVITLLSGQLAISTEVTLDASPLAQPVILDGNEAGRVLYINSTAVVTLTHLTIQHGRLLTNSTACENVCGGGIFINGDASVTLQDSLLTNNFASSGGAILNSGSLRIINSELSHNRAYYDGAGIRHTGALTIEHSNFLSNTSQNYYGGVIFAEGGTVSATHSTFAYNQAVSGGVFAENNGTAFYIENSTFAHNQASNQGSVLHSDLFGFFPVTNSIEIYNSTLSHNTAQPNGGTLWLSANLTATVSMTLTHITLADNSGGIVANSDDIGTISTSIQNSLIARTTDANCVGVSGNSYNLSDDDSCTGFNQQSPAFLGELANNGGLTQTNLPLTGSLAIGNGSTAVCQAPPINGSDQIGNTRPVEACTIGAVEAQQQFIYLPFIMR